MGRIIRRTVTITITESWTITWTTDEPSLPATTVVQDQPKAQEEPDATILPAVTPVAATDTPPTALSPKSGVGSKRKRRRLRRVAE